VANLYPPIPQAVYDDYKRGYWLHQPRVEPGRPDDTMLTTMAFPPTMANLRNFNDL